MNPLQSSLLHDAEFLEMDVTFENCHDNPYLLNVTRFSCAINKDGYICSYNCVHNSCNHLQGLILLLPESECRR